MVKIFLQRDLGLIPGSGGSLEKGMAIHFSVLAWIIPQKRSLAGYSPLGHKELDTTEQLTFTHDIIICMLVFKPL